MTRATRTSTLLLGLTLMALSVSPSAMPAPVPPSAAGAAAPARLRHRLPRPKATVVPPPEPVEVAPATLDRLRGDPAGTRAQGAPRAQGPRAGAGGRRWPAPAGRRHVRLDDRARLSGRGRGPRAPGRSAAEDGGERRGAGPRSADARQPGRRAGAGLPHVGARGWRFAIDAIEVDVTCDDDARGPLGVRPSPSAGGGCASTCASPAPRPRPTCAAWSRPPTA